MSAAGLHRAGAGRRRARPREGLTTMNITTDVEHGPRAARTIDHRRFGLHGHDFDTRVAYVAAVEAFGTFVLVLAIVGAVIPAVLGKPIAGDAFGSLAVPLAGGVALALLVALFGPVS